MPRNRVNALFLIIPKRKMRVHERPRHWFRRCLFSLLWHLSPTVAESKWHQELTTYQWRVLLCACLGWVLDIMDGYLYAIILFPAMSDLLGTAESAVIGWYGGIVLSIFMIGWALGGADLRSHRRPLRSRQNHGDYDPDLRHFHRPLRYSPVAGGSWRSSGSSPAWASAASGPPAQRSSPRVFRKKSRAKAAGIMQASGGLGFFSPRRFI